MIEKIFFPGTEGKETVITESNKQLGQLDHIHTLGRDSGTGRLLVKVESGNYIFEIRRQ